MRPYRLKAAPRICHIEASDKTENLVITARDRFKILTGLDIPVRLVLGTGVRIERKKAHRPRLKRPILQGKIQKLRHPCFRSS